MLTLHAWPADVTDALAVGNMVAYGPQTALEPVRELVYALLPSFRRNPAEGEPA